MIFIINFVKCNSSIMIATLKVSLEKYVRIKGKRMVVWNLL